MSILVGEHINVLGWWHTLIPEGENKETLPLGPSPDLALRASSFSCS